MGLAQASCAQKEFKIYVIRFMLLALLSGDDDICSNYMSC